MKQMIVKSPLALVLMLAVTGAAWVMAGETNKATHQLVVNLTDGSCVIGTTTLTNLPLQSEALGTMAILLEKVRSLKFSPNHESVIVALANGDKLQGSLDTVSLKLQTIFGPITIPLGKTTEIEVRSSERRALEFDGNQNYVTVPNNSTFFPQGAFTIECWAKISDQTHDWAFGPTSVAQVGWSVLIDGRGIMFQAFGLSGGPNFGIGYFSFDSNWHHVAVVYDASTLFYYIDGSCIYTQRSGGALSVGTQSLNIGRYPGSNFWAGQLDEIRISNTNRYTGTFTPRCTLGTDANTVAYWKFNDGSGATVADSSGNEHNGTLQGVPVPTWVSGATCAEGRR